MNKSHFDNDPLSKKESVGRKWGIELSRLKKAGAGRATKSVARVTVWHKRTPCLWCMASDEMLCVQRSSLRSSSSVSDAKQRIEIASYVKMAFSTFVRVCTRPQARKVADKRMNVMLRVVYMVEANWTCMAWP